jgi:alanine racemase
MPDLHQAGAILDIDLGAIRRNFRRLQDRLAGGKCAAVVKADGYGLGAAKIARALVKDGCDTFFVAHAGEGLSLRSGIGQGCDIYILNGVPPGAEIDCAGAGLIPVCNSFEQLAAWRQTAKGLGQALPVAVQVDSGMSRLGMAPGEVAAVAADPGAFDGLDLRLVMSHLACADEPSSPANEAQRRSFDTLRTMLPAAPASLANSSGIFLGGAYHYDLARPGAALYGVNPTPGKPNPMLPVVRLLAKVIQSRVLETGAGVGYGHVFRATGALGVATISLGYADGWPRRATAGGWFDGAPLPLVGRVSMDSIILDGSALAPGRLRAGDLVEMIGPNQTIDDVASMAGTIGYEILTGLGSRFHRRYEGG